jgi:hypothetical protein
MNSNYPTSTLSSYPLLRDVRKYVILRTCSRHWEQEMEGKPWPPADKQFITIDKALALLKLYLEDQADLYGCHIETGNIMVLVCDNYLL